MDEEDEIRSHPSPGTESPGSPRSNGRITVTVATSAPPNNALTLALPFQQQQQQQTPLSSVPVRSGNGGGREDCWSEGATGILIDAWGERYLELSRGNLKQKHWKEVADIVSCREDYSKNPKTDIQCKNRIDTVKKKYKLEKAKVSAGAGPSKWPFYERLDHLIGPSAKNSSAAVIPKGVPIGIPVGIRSAPQFLKTQQNKQFKRPVPVDSDSSPSENEDNSTDSFPPETYEVKRPRAVVQPREMNLMSVVRSGPGLGMGTKGKEKEKDDREEKDMSWANSVRELTRAILKFGEAYEHAESSKVQQLVDMEKQRMKFVKELELQRMQFFMKTQLELSQLKRKRGAGGANNSGNNHHNNTSNNSESSN